MSHFMHWCGLCPVAAVSTLLFYGVIVAALCSRSWREWVLARLAPPPPSTHAYSGALDAYRGLAALVVAFAHTVFFCYPIFWASMRCAPYLISSGGGRQAVPVFVMLSGLLIFRSLRKMNGAQDLRDYVRRRFLRIYPLYLVTAVAGICVGQAGFKIPAILSELFMLRSLNFPVFTNPPAWSLYVEVCFYVFLPIFVVATGRRAFWASVAAFCVLLFVDYAAAREMRLWKFFFVGIMVSHVSDWLAARVRRPAAKEALGTALFLAGATLMFIDLRNHDWFSDLKIVPSCIPEAGNTGYTVGLALGFSLVLLGSFASGLVSRVVGIWPLRVLGTISYSLYLIHPFYLLANFPQMVFSKVGSPQAFAAACGAAPWWYGFFVFFPGVLLWSAASYIAIERPFLMMRPVRPVRPAAGNEAREEKPFAIAVRKAA